MNSKKIILASASPRRYELLIQLGLTFDVEPAQSEEKAQDDIPPEEIVKRLAYAKADEIRKRHNAAGPSDAPMLIIGADTIVVKDGCILGKPTDEKNAFSMLQSLSGTTHQVYTGVALISSEWEVQFSEKTDVTFYPMTEEEIEAYIGTGEPMDKAGAYGIQGIGGRFVKEIRGDYNNVVGLPIARLYHVLKEI
ncbi:MAG: septum formation inhibitor Maf [Lachnospiraceae bacterium]|nr:septum formation inhibitor Maf [Lachnospiraceae bacterium]